MTRLISRRAVLASLSAVAGSAALADAPLRSPRPVARAAASPAPVAEATLPETRPQARPDITSIIDAAGLSGTVGVVLADARTGHVIESHSPDDRLPPASVTKAVTALYALDALGPEHRYVTRLLGTGPVVDGVLEGDLILAGGGDPHLQTDDLALLVETLRASGVNEVRGAFKVWGGALPDLDEIDEDQLDHLGYNPSISGLNLNFNRVHFEWKRQGSDYSVTMDARSETRRPLVNVAQMRIVDRSLPVYDYVDGGGIDRWSVARRALGEAGSRWLPVRYPALYTGDVFRSLAASEGLTLPAPISYDGTPDHDTLVTHQSADLRQLLQDMLRYSTNLTAEVTGLTATKAATGQLRRLRTSAFGMTRWTDRRAGIDPTFVDHSGLGDGSRISAREMAALLNSDGAKRTLWPILRSVSIRDDNGRPVGGLPYEVRAKTGTLNFVSSLAGYVRAQSGRELTFAIFAADLDARERGKRAGDEQPAGSISFNTRAKRLQQALLQRWGTR